MRLRPDPDLVSSARLFAAAIAREAGADERSIDDLKLAVTEACAAAIGAGAGAIDLELVADAARLSVRVAAAGIGDASAAHDAPIGHLALVSALFDDTDIGSDAVSFSVPLA
jgi:anti-sigma regulatory factor (Ser/Thr protein kinase)